MLGKIVKESQRDWDECLPCVMAAYRAAIAGLVLTYTRAYRIGDRVRVGDTYGDIVASPEMSRRLDEYVSRCPRPSPWRGRAVSRSP